MHGGAAATEITAMKTPVADDVGHDDRLDAGIGGAGAPFDELSGLDRFIERADAFAGRTSVRAAPKRTVRAKAWGRTSSLAPRLASGPH